MSKKNLDQFLKEGWRAEKDPRGVAVFGVGVIIAPSGICYNDEISQGFLPEGYGFWDKECDEAREFCNLVFDHLMSNGENWDYLRRLD